MSDIEITPELLEETKQQVKRGRHQFPSYVVLTLIKEVERLRAAQCWAIVTIETGVVDGPYATFEAAENERLAELCDDPNEPMYRVEPWKGGAE